jgi:micrococcal nuclease
MRGWIFLSVVLIASSALAADYEGIASVRDGDTIELHVGNKIVPVRLCGIDAPEGRHAGGPEATAKMKQIVEGKEVQCVQVGDGTPCDGRSKRTNHDRVVAQCFIEGKDISKEMVCSGNAVDWPKFSAGYYRCNGKE